MNVAHRETLPDGRRRCSYCRVFQTRAKLDRLPHGLYRCKQGTGCRPIVDVRKAGGLVKPGGSLLVKP